MSLDEPQMDAYAKGKAFTEDTNPGMEDALHARYDHLLPISALSEFKTEDAR